MRKLSYLFCAVTIALGVLGSVLRSIELNTVFDGISGLAEPHAPISIFLGVLSACAAVICLLFSSRFRGMAVSSDYFKAFSPSSSLFSVAEMLCGVLLSAASFFMFRSADGISYKLLSMLALLSGLCIIAGPLCMRRSGLNMLFVSLPVLFGSYYLIVCYRAVAEDPVVLDYIYQFLGMCSALVALYLFAGYAFGSSKPGKTMFFSHIGAYFGIVSLPDSVPLAHRLICISFTAYFLVHSITLASNLEKSGRNP